MYFRCPSDALQNGSFEYKKKKNLELVNRRRVTYVQPISLSLSLKEDEDLHVCHLLVSTSQANPNFPGSKCHQGVL